MSRYGVFHLLYYIYRNPCVCPIFGNVGGGKTAFMFRLSELLHELGCGDVYLYNYPESAMGYLPGYFVRVESINDVPSDSVLLRDDSALSDDTHAKKSMTEKAVEYSRFLALIRQKGIRLLFTVQNTALFNKDSFRFGRNILFFKYYDPVSLMFERSEFKELIESVMMMFYKKVEKGYLKEALTFCLSEPYTGFFLSSLPSFWSDKISRAFEQWEVKI